MAYVPVPKDLTAVKSKVAFNLTLRQIVCFGVGVLLGLPTFFLVRSHGSVSAAALIMIIIMMPAFLLAMYEKQGLPLEKYARCVLQVYFFRPKVRPYATNNFYGLLERQANLDKEVYRIVHKTEKATVQKRKKAD